MQVLLSGLCAFKHRHTIKPNSCCVFQAKPHIDSFRTRGDKGASFKNYDSDKIPRRGPKYQHGIYEPAQS